jgi:hypothetical protein
MIGAVAVILLAVLSYFGWQFTSRSAYESAQYKVMQSEGDCEVRDYPDLMLARTSMRDISQGDDGSFMRLFRFISGDNQAKQKIAMTVPVFMERDALQENASMGFVVPSDVTAKGIPQPLHEEVEISQRSGGRFAVIRFSGPLNDSTRREQERLLREWMSSRNLRGLDNTETAGYDPPWTPNPFRRNEILIKLVNADIVEDRASMANKK